MVKDPAYVNDAVIELQRPQAEHVVQGAVPASARVKRPGSLTFGSVTDVCVVVFFATSPLCPDDPWRRVGDPATAG